MSAAAAAGSFGGSNQGKKAVHVKWAGKTIALGTFPAAEADEKCARAKALTRAWRSTMRPKPSRDWVMLELERLGVRVVSGRLGRKAGEEEGEEGAMPASGKKPAAGGGGQAERNNSMGWGPGSADLDSLIQQRRNSSLGLSMMDQGRRGSLSSLGQVVGGLEGDPSMPPHRPLVGGGAAAAYEAARHDHFTQKSAEQQRRASSLGLGNLAGGGLGQMGGMSVNPNQHYEMLKLHHMNLLNEIQETTLMMNLYQQQQLQQQQQQLQQQATAEGTPSSADANMAMMLQQQQQQQNAAAGSVSDALAQLGQQQRASLGLGTTGPASMPGGAAFSQMQMLQQQQQGMVPGASGEAGGADAMPSMAPSGEEAAGQLKGDETGGDQQGDATPVAPVSGGDAKRPAEEDEDEEKLTKRAKTDDAAEGNEDDGARGEEADGG